MSMLLMVATALVIGALLGLYKKIYSFMVDVNEYTPTDDDSKATIAFLKNRNKEQEAKIKVLQNKVYQHKKQLLKVGRRSII